MVRLRAGGQSKVDIYTFGAHVTSWCDASGTEKIYTSPTALYNGIKAIRGGIPVCFPQFAKTGPLKQHGFARTSTWTIDRAYADPATPAARFVLTDSQDTRNSAWPFQFELSLVVKLAEDGNFLSLVTNVENKDARPFSFTFALHSYFTCNSDEVQLTDYDGLTYLDNTDEMAQKSQQGTVTFGKEVDRVYVATKNKLVIAQSPLSIDKSNLPEAVVWNPHIEKTAALADMPDGDWRRFICIEPARVVDPAHLQAGQVWTASVNLSSA